MGTSIDAELYWSRIGGLIEDLRWSVGVMGY
jgi:hypothetical protein